MPRIYLWEDNESLPYDYCKRCWPKQKRLAQDDEMCDVDAEHPAYEETDYVCDNCGRKLGEKDNAK